MSHDAETLDQLVERRAPEGASIGPNEIQGLMAELGVRDPDAVMTAGSALREWADGSSDLEFNPSGWRVQMAGKAAQAALVSAVLFAGLLACGVTIAVPATIATAIVPLLFDIERIKLTRREEEVRAHLVLRNYDRTGTPNELYDALPEEVREELGRLDFLDILAAIVASGHGENEGGEVRIFRSGDGRFAISFE